MHNGKAVCQCHEKYEGDACEKGKNDIVVILNYGFMNQNTFCSGIIMHFFFQNCFSSLVNDIVTNGSFRYSE